ncbi:unnamed protein product [Caenorhabditis bovis]|uniref:Vacuolar protein sorting-associated protein 72 homolog n=1 Tax=Caenorhabditis bovis TaxID=2654633 RepID=A0A8S1FDL6_9PELO|nr:unnamed protein product [Caenorhabditis bovis]
MPPRSTRRLRGRKKEDSGTPDVTKTPEDNEEKVDEGKSSGRNTKSREVSEDKSSSKSGTKSEESSSDDDDTPVPLMVHERVKRSTAGNKMASLLSSAEQEDDFYKTAYGGFDESTEGDKEFTSPVHSDEDEVDSDFDKPEEEDEPVSGEEEDPDKKRRKRKFKEPRRGLSADEIAKNKKWAMARLAGNSVAANTVDEKTQAKMLKEAEETERINVESLKKYEEFELEKKKKREKATVRVFPPGPREQIKMTADGTTVTLPAIKKFECCRAKPRSVCAVTGRPARYFDPVTRLPYSTPYAFKVIRDKYNKYLRTIEGNPEVDAYLARLKQLPTPPDSPVPIALNPTSMVAESSISA